MVSLGWVQNSLRKEAPILQAERLFIILNFFLKTVKTRKCWSIGVGAPRGALPHRICRCFKRILRAEYWCTIYNDAMNVLFSHEEVKIFFPQIRRLGAIRSNIRKSKIWQNQTVQWILFFFHFKAKVSVLKSAEIVQNFTMLQRADRETHRKARKQQ